MAKTIISAALTGAVTPKSLTPHIPITPREIADDAIRVWKEGAAIVHLHMRNEEGRGSLETARFKEAVDRIRDNTDLVLNLSTSGGGNVSDEKRFEHVVTLLPEIASYDVGTFNWLPGGIFPNVPGEALPLRQDGQKLAAYCFFFIRVDYLIDCICQFYHTPDKYYTPFYTCCQLFGEITQNRAGMRGILSLSAVVRG